MEDNMHIESKLLTGIIAKVIKKALKKSGIAIDDIRIDYITLQRRVGGEPGYYLHTEVHGSISDKELDKIKENL